MNIINKYKRIKNKLFNDENIKYLIFIYINHEQ